MNVKITDIDGRKPSFTQWDVDRVLYISGCDSQPCLHFANILLKRAIVVEAEADGRRWVCRVPNFILQYAEPMLVSVFVQPDEGKTVLMTWFPVTPKMKPQDYTYEENIGYVNWVQKSKEAQDLIDEVQAMIDGGSVVINSKQSDWDESDPTDAAYIKNKPTIPNVSGKLDKAQGAANAGKFMVVGADGNITAVTMAAWQGGNY